MTNSLEAVWQSYRNAILEMSGEETSPDDLAFLELERDEFRSDHIRLGRSSFGIRLR